MTLAIRQIVTVQPGGRIEIQAPELEPGTQAEVIVLMETTKRTMIAADMLASDLVGLWADREDIGDSAEFARKLREQAQHRGGNDRDLA